MCRLTNFDLIFAHGANRRTGGKSYLSNLIYCHSLFYYQMIQLRYRRHNAFWISESEGLPPIPFRWASHFTADDDRIYLSIVGDNSDAMWRTDFFEIISPYTHPYKEWRTHCFFLIIVLTDVHWTFIGSEKHMERNVVVLWINDYLKNEEYLSLGS